MLFLRQKLSPYCVFLLFLCSAHVIAAVVPVAMQQVKDDTVFLTVNEWNEKYCTRKGCKPMTDEMFLRTNTNNYTRLDMIRRNTAFADPLFQLELAPSTRESVLNRDAGALPYIGIMVDAASYYFPLDWIQNLLRHMKRLQFNLLHLRLASDLAFRVRLEGVPGLAPPESYTAAELKQLVALADALGIAIMPEIGVPTQAGGWALPGMMVACPSVMCHKAETPGGIPFNLLQNPRVVAETVDQALLEITSIFHTSPFLHLGSGLTDYVTLDCLEEANQNASAFAQHANVFERHLKDVFQDKPQRIVRWEAANQQEEDKVTRTFDVLQRTSRGRPSDTATTAPYFATPDQLDFQGNGQAPASEIFAATRDLLLEGSGERRPLAIVVSTLHMDAHHWLDRNVMGRLVAVAMGAASTEEQHSEFKLENYQRLCRRFLEKHESSEALCELNGLPVLSEFLHLTAHEYQQEKAWPVQTCSRLTTRTAVRQLQGRLSHRHRAVRTARANFWNRLGEEPFPSSAAAATTTPHDNATTAPFLQNVDKGTAVPHRGILLDLVRIDCDENSMTRIFKILDAMHFLGLNTLQLRVMSDLGFVVELPRNSHGKELLSGTDHPYSVADLARIGQRATSLGIQIIPEMSTVTRGGGWFEAGLAIACPNILCTDKGLGVGAVPDDKYESMVTLIASVLRDLLDVFPGAPFVHLGYDERLEVKACYDEAGKKNVDVDLDSFEQRLMKVLDFQDVNQARLIRWENSEGVLYPNRAGRVTHYRLTEPARGRTAQGGVEPRPIFLSSGLNFGEPMQQSNGWSVYQHTRTLQSQNPMGIIAIVDLVHESFWREFEIEESLVALAMGLSSRSHHRTKTEFHQELDAVLKIIRRGESGSDPINKDVAAQRLKHHWVTRVERSCSERTVQIPKLLPKQGVVV